jgi:hypothetical protein
MGFCLFTIASRPALGPTQPPTQWVLGALTSGIKRLGREADHSPPSNAEVKNCVGLYLHCRNTLLRHSAQLNNGYIFIACLVKHRGNFTLFVIFQNILWRNTTWSLAVSVALK